MTLYFLDCGIGNVGAIQSMYRRLGVRAELIDQLRELTKDNRLILPGRWRVRRRR